MNGNYCIFCGADEEEYHTKDCIEYEPEEMRVILHLCADIGSDSYPYQIDPEYEVILVGKDIGVENYSPDRPIHGIIANPVCTEFSFAKFLHRQDEEKGMLMVRECQRIIKEAEAFGELAWWVLENPYNGSLKKHIGWPRHSYHPWMYGSPWTKKTALWGHFIMPWKNRYEKWEDVPKNEKLYIRPGRKKPNFAFLHKSAIHDIPEFAPFVGRVDSDNAFRSLCSQGFARAFKEVNP